MLIPCKSLDLAACFVSGLQTAAAGSGFTSFRIDAPFSRSAVLNSYSSCRRVQSPGVIRKYRLKRKSCSGVQRRRPFFISDRCGPGIPVAFAIFSWDRPDSSIASRSVSAKKFGIGSNVFISMIINYSHISRMAILPLENQPPLFVDSNAIKSLEFPVQSFQMIWNRHLELIQAFRLLKLDKLDQRPNLNIQRELSRLLPLENFLSLLVREAFNHFSSLSFLINSARGNLKNKNSERTGTGERRASITPRLMRPSCTDEPFFLQGSAGFQTPAFAITSTVLRKPVRATSVRSCFQYSGLYNSSETHPP